MSRLNKLLKAFSLIVKKPYLLNHVLNDNNVFKEQTIKTYNLPHGLPQIDLTALFPDFNAEVFPYAFLSGGSLPTDLALLKALAKKYNVTDYLEIGTWRGESVANVASVVPHCYTMNLPDETMLKMGLSEDYVNAHRYFSKNLNNVTHIFAHSHEFDFKILDKKFDMVFIDADHHYESVIKDTQTAFNIIKDGKSIIVWHDYASSPETIRWDVMKAILDGTPKDKRNKLFHISHTLCAVYLNDNFPVQTLQAYAMPNKVFKVKLEKKDFYPF